MAQSDTADFASRRPRLAGYSFCIITNGKRPAKLRREIESIRALGIPAFEIIVGGELPRDFSTQGLRVVPLPEAARAGRVSAMRNRLTEAARFDRLVVADDDLLFHGDFYAGLLAYGDDFEVLSVRILNPDGTRFWDWATYGGPRGHCLLDYGETDPFVYLTGGLGVMKAHIADRVKWDEALGYYQLEDVEFSGRLRRAGIAIRFCPYSTVTHDDDRYSQVGTTVVRRGPLEEAHGNRARYP